jgi:hypothetical protein
MATDKPRITVTLPPRSHEVLARFAKLNGQSMSSVVADFVELVIPSLVRAVAFIERAQGAGDEVKAGMRASLEKADRELFPLLEKALSQSDMFLAEIAAIADARGAADAMGRTGGDGPAQRGGRKGRRALPQVVPEDGSTPVPVTRGSGGPTGAV